MKYLIILTILFASCKVIKQTDRRETKSDSVAVKKIDSGSVRKSDESTIKASKVTVAKVEKKDRVITTIVEDYKIDTLKGFSSGLIRRTTIIDQDKGKIKHEETKTDTLHTKSTKIDSAYKKESDSIKVVKSELIKVTDKKSTQGGWLINMGFIVVLLLGAAIGVRYWIRRRIKNKLGL